MTALAIDTETTGLRLFDRDRPFAIFTCNEEGDVAYWEWEVDTASRQPIIPRKDIDEFIDYLDGYDDLVFHNYSFDIKALESIGIEFDYDTLWGKVHDTGVMGHVVHNRKTCQLYSQLKPMAEVFVGIKTDDEKDLKDAVIAARRYAKKVGWNRGPVVECDYWLPKAAAYHKDESPVHPWHHVLADYGAKDVERTMSLYLYFRDGLVQEQLEPQYERERELFPVIHDMTKGGLPLRPHVLREEIEKRVKRIEKAKRTMRRLVKDDKFEPASVYGLRAALYDKLKFPVIARTKSGLPAADKGTLNALHSSAAKGVQTEFIDALSEFRKASTAHGYLEEYQREQHDGVLYYSLKQHGTSTTRFSSSNPNAQNVGKGNDITDEEGNTVTVDSLRVVFGPQEGRLWVAMDYSQLQLRIFAYVSEEPSLIEAFDKGWDAHDYMAHRIFGLPDGDKPTKIQRRIAKNVNFGFVFGAQPAKIESTAGIKGLWGTVTSMFPNAHKFMNRIKSQVMSDRYVTTPGGYRLYLPYKDGRIAAHAGVNYIVQGCEGDIVKDALILNYRYLKAVCPEARIVLTVHDEIIYDFPTSLPRREIKRHARRLKRNMELAGLNYGMKTPVDAELITTSWDKGQDLAL